MMKTALGLEVWKTVRIDRKRNAECFRRALRDGKFNLWIPAMEILERSTFADTGEVSLVKVTVTELYFTDGATRKDIFSRARELGLIPCPAEIGPRLRLQYPDQPDLESILIAMEPIKDFNGTPRSFSVDHFGIDFRITAFQDRSEIFWSADSQWVFSLPRK